MNYLWDLIEDLPGIRAIRVDESTGSTMAGFYAAAGTYIPEELHGLSVVTFVEAVNAEIGGGEDWVVDGVNFCLHTHEYFKTYDFDRSGKPSRIVNADRDVRELDKELKKSEEIMCFTVPWLKKYNKEWIEKIAGAIKNVIENHEELLAIDNGDKQGGHWYGNKLTKR